MFAGCWSGFNKVTVDTATSGWADAVAAGRTRSKKDPRRIRIELKIFHEELSEMVGTTRPRISMFMQRFSQPRADKMHGALSLKKQNSVIFLRRSRNVAVGEPGTQFFLQIGPILDNSRFRVGAQSTRMRRSQTFSQSAAMHATSITCVTE